MPKAIQTKYLGPTNYKGGRIKAFAEGGNSITLSYPDNGDPHRIAADALSAKLKWADCDWIEGGLPKGDSVFVSIYTKRFIRDKRDERDLLALLEFAEHMDFKVMANQIRARLAELGN